MFNPKSVGFFSLIKSIGPLHLGWWGESLLTWQWSSVKAWLERIIWFRSVSISSYTIYTSLKFSLSGGLMMSLILIICTITMQQISSYSQQKKKKKSKGQVHIWHILCSTPFSKMCIYLSQHYIVHKIKSMWNKNNKRASIKIVVTWHEWYLLSIQLWV